MTNVWKHPQSNHLFCHENFSINPLTSDTSSPTTRISYSVCTYFTVRKTCQFNKEADVHDRSWWTSSAKLGSSPHQKIQSSRRPGVWCLLHTLSTSAFRQRLKLHRMGSSSVTGKRMGDEVGPCHTKHFHLIPVRSAWRQRERENVLEKSIMWDGLAATSDKSNNSTGVNRHAYAKTQPNGQSKCLIVQLW